MCSFATNAGAAELDAAAAGVMDALAKALSRCGGIKMEIAGHTDSQGSEDGNRTLSQARAEAVLLALQGRQVDVSGLIAKGYGEAEPIADNATEIGREANRRIAFTLIGDGKRGTDGPVLANPAQVVTPAATAAAAPAEDASSEPKVEGPDFSADTSPSVAPKEKTIRAQRRPDASP